MQFCPPGGGILHYRSHDIWFDDVDVEFIEGEPVAKRQGEESTSSISMITGPDKR